MSPIDQNRTQLTNLRAAFGLWDEGKPLPRDARSVARAALQITVGDMLRGRGANLILVRFADDDVSEWRLDALHRLAMVDLIRAVAGALEPAAYAIALIQPMHAPSDPTLRGVHCRAACGDELFELTGDVVYNPGQESSIPTWAGREGRVTDPTGRWIGVPPTVPIALPMLGVGEA